MIYPYRPSPFPQQTLALRILEWLLGPFAHTHP